MTGTVTKPRPRRQLKNRLRRLGITQDAIAAHARQASHPCTRTYVNHFVNGRRSPKWLRLLVNEMITEARTAAS